MTDEEAVIGIFVLPTQRGRPPSAVIGPVVGEALIASKQVIWSRDVGAWMDGDVPVQADLGDAITVHARNLGVEW